ncbi:MAG: SPOR domain-containing protein, partial [Acidobacteriota bacterium]|nr:SPOR domain-containing protein [Acidobacteriota bacterium]
AQEHELVLGNKQLLSAFFIVVVLLGVFFTMGYIIGRNATLAPVSADTGAAAKPVDAQADKPHRSMPLEPPAASGAEIGMTSPANRSSQDPSQEVLTQQAKPYDDSRAAAATQPAEKPVVTPVEGRNYLQVMAVKRSDAERVQKILNGRGFPVTLRESSKEGLFRVLVGPYQDRPSLSKARDDLKGAGFDAIVAH